MQEFTLSVSGVVKTFSSTLSDDEAAIICQGLESRFAQSIASARNRSDKQRAWLHYLAVTAKQEQSKPKTEQVNEPVILGRILVHFRYAQTKGQIQKPKMRFMLGDRLITICICRDDVCIFVADKYYSKIGSNGHLIPPRNWDAEVIALLVQVNEDPLKNAALYGKRIGRCCFCNRALSNDVSIEKGYGPICADKFGLEHNYSDKSESDDSTAAILTGEQKTLF